MIRMILARRTISRMSQQLMMIITREQAVVGAGAEARLHMTSFMQQAKDKTSLLNRCEKKLSQTIPSVMTSAAAK